jgi:parvulin-like peptidyl-prolyl isomerase
MAIQTVGRGRALTALGLLTAAAVGFWLGHGAPQSTAVAAPPAPAAPAPQTPASDYSQRVVAYIYQSIPITREDLGEYMIARHGLDNVDLLVNKKIIEYACQKRDITVTDAEIEASILADCDSIGVKKGEFIQKVLKQYNKTLYEWKEDVIKPRLLLTKLVKDRIKVEDADVRKAFDAAYGEKRDVRIIIWPNEPAEDRAAMKEYDDIRKSEEGFDRKARTQANSALASTGGRIKPISHNSGVHGQVENAAFTLQPGEVSSLIKTGEGTIVLKMDKVVPPDTTVKFEDKKESLYKDVFDKKVAAEIPVLFKALREEAKPVFILKKPESPTAIDEEAIKKEIQQTGGPGMPKP